MVCGSFQHFGADQSDGFAHAHFDRWGQTFPAGKVRATHSVDEEGRRQLVERASQFQDLRQRQRMGGRTWLGGQGVDVAIEAADLAGRDAHHRINQDRGLAGRQKLEQRRDFGLRSVDGNLRWEESAESLRSNGTCSIISTEQVANANDQD